MNKFSATPFMGTDFFKIKLYALYPKYAVSQCQEIKCKWLCKIHNSEIYVQQSASANRKQ